MLSAVQLLFIASITLACTIHLIHGIPINADFSEESNSAFEDEPILYKRKLPVEGILIGRRALPTEGILLGRRHYSAEGVPGGRRTFPSGGILLGRRNNFRF